MKKALFLFVLLIGMGSLLIPSSLFAQSSLKGKVKDVNRTVKTTIPDKSEKTMESSQAKSTQPERKSSSTSKRKTKSYSERYREQFSSKNTVRTQRSSNDAKEESGTVQKRVQEREERANNRNFRREARRDYTDLYNDTYKNDDYAERYRKNYAENPIYTHSSDYRSWRRYSYYSDQDVDVYDENPKISPPEPMNYPGRGMEYPVPQYYPPQVENIHVYPNNFFRPPAFFRYTQGYQPEAVADEIKASTKKPDKELSATQEKEESKPVLQSPSQLIFNEGMDALNKRNYRKAKLIFARLEKLDPDNGEIKVVLGTVLFALGEYKKAKQAIQTGVGIARNNDEKLPKFEELFNHPVDFRILKSKLARYVENNPTDSDATTLLLLLNKPTT